MQEPKLQYTNTAEARSAREDFQNLKTHPAWRRIVAYYDQKIEYLEQVITGDIGNDNGSSIITSIEDLERWRDKRNMALQFRNLPDILTEAEALNEQPEPNLDPFA